VDLARLRQVLQLDRRGRRQLLVDDLVAEVDALVADVDAGSGDQLLDLALRLAAEAAEELLVRVCGPCQRNPLLAGLWVAYRLVPNSLEGTSSRPFRVRWITPRHRRSLFLAATLRGDTVAGIAAAASIEPVTEQQLGRLLPLIAAYQRFYEVEEIDDERNRAFFSRFLAPSDDGMLLGAWCERELVGYACLYWTFTSLVPAELVLMNDLYVEPGARGKGIGRALIEASAAVARRRGAHHLQWVTAPDNRTAQRLYDSTGARSEPSIEYELEL
jgi:GNAT superfamily N-acetyltransferase